MNFASILFVCILSAAYATPLNKTKSSNEKLKQQSVIEKYKKDCENIDIDMYLNNERLFKPYINCLSNDGKCPAIGETIKQGIKEAIIDNCANCSEKQKEIVRKVIDYMSTKKPAQYEKMCDIFDPDHSHRAQLVEFVAAGNQKQSDEHTSEKKH